MSSCLPRDLQEERRPEGDGGVDDELVEGTCFALLQSYLESKKFL